MPNTYRIQVLTNDDTKWGRYSDAQYFQVPIDMTIEQFVKENEDKINAEKDARIQRWGDAIENPPPPIEPSEEELLAQKQSLLDQVAQIEAQTVELDSKIQAIQIGKIKPIEDVIL